MFDAEKRKKEAHITESVEDKVPEEITNIKVKDAQKKLTKEERINFDVVVRYRCRWCGKEGLKLLIVISVNSTQNIIIVSAAGVVKA